LQVVPIGIESRNSREDENSTVISWSSFSLLVSTRYGRDTLPPQIKGMTEVRTGLHIILAPILVRDDED